MLASSASWQRRSVATEIINWLTVRGLQVPRSTPFERLKAMLAECISTAT